MNSEALISAALAQWNTIHGAEIMRLRGEVDQWKAENAKLRKRLRFWQALLPCGMTYAVAVPALLLTFFRGDWTVAAMATFAMILGLVGLFGRSGGQV